jgi:hypothetical protein
LPSGNTLLPLTGMSDDPQYLPCSDRLVCDRCGCEDVEQAFNGRFPANVRQTNADAIRSVVVWEDEYFCPRCDAWVSTSYMDPDWKD